ncbi:MAG: hypothetical protein JNM25_11940 [Planctomycetes bacterium]|nr:hypothetical protein [Planctomycetota bacterium]
MNLGILGRDPAVLARAMQLAARHGHVPQGTLRDADALAWVQQGSIEGLVIGGGVEPAPRRALLDACRARGVRPIEVFGPENLDHALGAL